MTQVPVRDLVRNILLADVDMKIVHQVSWQYADTGSQMKLAEDGSRVGIQMSTGSGHKQ